MALLLIVISLVGLVNNQIIHTQADPLYYVCSNTTTFTPNSKYQKNLKTLLASLRSLAADPTANGFSNYNVSLNKTEVSYGQFLCRGDLSKNQCRECVKNATQEVAQLCPKEKSSIIWYDECMLRYSNKSFSLTSDEEASVTFYNVESVGNDTTRFAKLVNDTLKGLARKLTASDGISGRMFEAAEVNFTSSDTLYAFAQCAPFLSTKNCSSCLMQSIEGLASCCSTSKGGRVLNPSCNVRFELYPFYNTSVLLLEAPEPAPGPVPFPSPPAEAPVQYPPAPSEAPAQNPPAPASGPPGDASPPSSPTEGPTLDSPPTVASAPGSGNSKKSPSTFVAIATPIAAFLVLFSFKF